MYIMLTSRCNMSCEHCCRNCTHEGIDMSQTTWEAALDLAMQYGESVALGGGEPTLHPLFWNMLGESIATAEYVWLATNGSQTKIALALAKMAKKGIIGCALSQDSFHDPIDPEVIQAFTKKEPSRYGGFDNNTPDCREIRNVEPHIIKTGRATWGDENDCVCEGIMIEPDGTIKACGCDDAPSLGTVFDPKIPQDWDTNSCHKNQQ